MRSNAEQIFDGSAVVVISSISRPFFVANFGSPETLFNALVLSAREAYFATGTILTEGGQVTPDAGFRAAAYMAGVLLRDLNFTPGRTVLKVANNYQVDFLSDTIQLRTEFFTAKGVRSASFSVKVDGRIIAGGGDFAVSDMVTGAELVRFREKDLQMPHFFTETLPLLAYEARIKSVKVSAEVERALADQNFEIQLAIPVGSEMKSVVIHKRRGDLQTQVRDAQSGNTLLRLPIDCINDMAKLLEILQHYLSIRQNASVTTVPASNADPNPPATPLLKGNLLQQSLEAVKSKTDELVGRFYEALFERCPEARPLFEHVSKDAQRTKLLQALSTLVSNAEKSEFLVPYLEGLGKLHVAYGVKPQQLDFVKDAIVEAFAQTAGPLWKEEHAAAWTKVCHTVIEIMKRAMAGPGGTAPHTIGQPFPQKKVIHSPARNGTD